MPDAPYVTACGSNGTSASARPTLGKLRLDPDLLDWFKRQEPGYQAQINATLRPFVEAHERSRGRS